MTALNYMCAGCRIPVDIMLPDTVCHRGPLPLEPKYYHLACWRTGWYTGIEPKGEWPIESDPWPEEVGHGASDPVNNPSHYRWLPNGIEVIDITETLNFCMGNAIKYILRADHKGKPIEDLEKSVWYIRREIERRVRDNAND